MPEAKSFSVYEFGGVLAPGTLVLLLVGLANPSLDVSAPLARFSVGGAVVFLVVGYVAGQILQALGNLIEGLVWRAAAGWPTDWVRSGRHFLLAPGQQERLSAYVKTEFHVDLGAALPASQWRSITRQIYSVVQEHGTAASIDRFNSTYGLMRGVGAALVVASVVSLVTSWPQHIGVAALLAVGSALAFYRMGRFGRYYAHELFIRLLNVQTATPTPSKTK